jgi:hypothetical protein
MRFCGGAYFAERGDAIVVVVAQNRVSEGFDGVLADHHVAGNDDADGAFAPALVEMGICV